MRAAFIVYIDILENGWVGDQLIRAKKKVEKTLREGEPNLASEVSFLPPELYPLVIDEEN